MNTDIPPPTPGKLILLRSTPAVEPEEAPVEDVREPLEGGAPPPPHLVEAATEALLLAADGPVSVSQLNEWLCEPGLEAVHIALLGIRNRLRTQGSGVQLVQVAKGWQYRTELRFARWVAGMNGSKPVRLSRAALETLAIVAYRQPVTRTEVEDLRGVDSGGVLRMLCDRTLVRVDGRQDTPGRPLLYGTSGDFLSLFGLRDLSELPTLRDLRELQRDDAREGPIGSAGQLELEFE